MVKNFWIYLDILTLVFIFIPSWEGKYEIDRLLNVLDLIQRCFAFILESLRRIRDRCIGNRTFIHILGLPLPTCWWSFRSRPCSRCCWCVGGRERQRQRGRGRNTAAVFAKPPGGQWLGQRHVKGCGWEEVRRKERSRWVSGLGCCRTWLLLWWKWEAFAGLWAKTPMLKAWLCVENRIQGQGEK